ncbi:5'-nucleotidase C-terminal domain-containing protein [Halopiger goleimassiliensis]|uniref:5'-nucleotidase C-terminal domain-containing protein n=1 Tax=Halopiger goleimassiliensis TaxID=1293048 RepID=UPI000677BE6C|nr:5'-nucleotidase C-terminal domain-containing protein [Halopiger goleimassiliensis]
MSTPRLVHLADLETIYDEPERVARLAGAIRDRRDERTLVVGSGDTTALGALAFVSEEGRGLARPLYETIAPDADTLGNHEFDYGTDGAVEWTRTTPGRHLLANVEGIATDGIDSSTILEAADTRIGLVGVTGPRTDEISGIDLEAAFTDPIPAIREASDRLRSRGCEWLVVLSHCGSLDATIAAETDVDLVLGGHDHERVCERIDGTLVARTEGGQAGEFQEIRLTDPPAVAVRTIDDEPRHEGIESTYRERYEATGLAATVTTLPDAIDRPTATRVVARAYRERADAAVGVVPRGSVRDGLPKTVTRGDVVGIVPFGSTLDVHRVDGQTLATVVDRCTTEAPAAGDLTAVVDPALETDPIDPSAAYRLACMSYLTEVDLIPELDAETRLEDRGPQHRHVLAFLEEKGSVTDLVTT